MGRTVELVRPVATGGRSFCVDLERLRCVCDQWGGSDMEPCNECRALIDGASMIYEHPGLRGYGTSKVFADFTSDTYECDICHTKFHRHEAKPSRNVTWTVIE